MSHIRIMVTDDHELVRAGIVHFLEVSPGIKVVGQASSGEELLRQLRAVPVDVLLLDMTMPGESGVNLIAHVKSIYPDMHILILSGFDETPLVLNALQAGASGYMSKSCSPKCLLDAIRKIAATGRHLEPWMAEKLAYATALPASNKIEMILSDRELDVLRLIVAGRGVKDIASQLFITDKTVSTHKSHILQKLGLRNTVELVRYVAQRELFS